MAEIKVEKKKPVWPWILLIAIIILGILFYVFAYDESNDDVDDFDDTDDIEELDETSASGFIENKSFGSSGKTEFIS